MARFKRLDGYDVKFLTGTDEHGQKVEKTAIAAGKEPQEFCDEIAGLFQRMTKTLNISNDDFIRTTEERHIRSCQAIWAKLEEAGDIYLGNYAGWYSVRDEAYFDEGELTDGPEGKLAPSGAPVEWVEEPSYFFKLSDYGDKLLAYYEANPDFIMPASRRNEVVNFVKQGLRDLSISRTTFKWGVPVADNPDHIMYVWLDALTNYITALGYPDTDGEFARYWPADVHIIGKDITRFHSVYWPAFLMSAGIELPKRVFGHGFLNVDGEKMSKSVGNVLSPDVMVEEFGLDQVRFYLLREVPYGSDGSISTETMIHRINGELANDLGNLAQRVLSMINKNCDGAVPEPGDYSDADETILAQAHGVIAEVRESMDVQAFHVALEAIWRVVRAANGYVDAQAPWTLRKEDPDRMKTVLYVLAEVIRHLAILMQPFVPDSAARMLDQLEIPEDARDYLAIGDDRRLAAGTVLPKPEGIFPRYEAAEG